MGVDQKRTDKATVSILRLRPIWLNGGMKHVLLFLGFIGNGKSVKK